MTPHSAYVWYPLNCKWHHIHSITSNNSIYDVTSTSGMTSQPLYQTSNPLYLCHYNLSTDITPTIVWHHIYILCEIIFTIYIMTSNPYVITLLYWWHDNLYIWNHIQYVGQHMHYTCDITATICVITPTVLRASHPLFVWHQTRHRYSIFCTREHITYSLYEIKPPF